MDRIERTITEHLVDAINTFPAVLLTGPRQVGKASLRQLLFQYSLIKLC